MIMKASTVNAFLHAGETVIPKRKYNFVVGDQIGVKEAFKEKENPLPGVAKYDYKADRMHWLEKIGKGFTELPGYTNPVLMPDDAIRLFLEVVEQSETRTVFKIIDKPAV